MKIHAKQLNQEVQDLLDGNSSNGHCYNSDDEYHNSDSEQDLDNYEILKNLNFINLLQVNKSVSWIR